MTDVHGNIIAPHHVVNQYITAMRRQSRPQQVPATGRRDLTQPTYPLRPSSSASRSDHQPVSAQAVNTSHTGHPQSHSQQRNNAYGDALPLFNNSSGNSDDNNTVPATFPQQEFGAPSGLPFADDFWLAAHAQQPHAQDSTAPDESGLGYGHGHGAPAQHVLPPRSREAPTQPTIRVTTAWAHDFPRSQPQDDAYSAVPTSSHSPLHLYNTHLTPAMSHPYPSLPQDPDTMQTPVSPVSADNPPHDHIMGDDQQQMSRKRSHSVMSQPDASLLASAPLPDHHRDGSIGSAGASPNGVNDEFSPRGSRAFKRGEPPTNAMGKYICTFSQECEGQIFERKCEWSKHMDKHDRPYRCPHPQCAKLQGFTYSGGLLRHEREVHGKHGGPKSQLMCPHTDCKRHTGKGFTRKENLNEHLRRVHPGDKDSQNSILTRTATDGLLAEDGESQISKIEMPEQHEEYDMTSPAKRKRSLPADIDGVLIEDPEREIKRLRAELAHRDHLIQQMEQDLMQHHETRRQLEELQQMHQTQQQVQALPNGQV